MGVMRSVLLAASENRWLRKQAPRMGFVKKAVKRFMPGERVEDALAAAKSLAGQRVSTIMTRLGENITDLREAEEVTQHYLDVLDQLAGTTLDAQISIKPTQLGLDVDQAQCLANLRQIAAAAHARGRFVWIDMEQHGYVDATLDLYRRALGESPNLGVALQSYLYRTPKDVDALVPLGGGIRLVKGAYLEPASVAYPKKADVDRVYLELARGMLTPRARQAGLQAVFGTHDLTLIGAIQQHAAQADVPKEAYEFAMLYGIQRGEQARLAAEQHRVRVLISYGEYWFPWYMRRLAERPANVIFVAKSMFSN